jgi:hypothetical protein
VKLQLSLYSILSDIYQILPQALTSIYHPVSWVALLPPQPHQDTPLNVLDSAQTRHHPPNPRTHRLDRPVTPMLPILARLAVHNHAPLRKNSELAIHLLKRRTVLSRQIIPNLAIAPVNRVLDLVDVHIADVV